MRIPGHAWAAAGDVAVAWAGSGPAGLEADRMERCWLLGRRGRPASARAVCGGCWRADTRLAGARAGSWRSAPTTLDPPWTMNRAPSAGRRMLRAGRGAAPRPDRRAGRWPGEHREREQYLQALAGLRETTRTQAERVARMLAKQGEVQAGQVSRAAEDLVRRTRSNREQLSRLLQREVKRQLGAVGIATREEVARLQQRVRALEQAAQRSGRPAGAGRRPAASRAASGTARTSTRTRTSGARSGSAAASPGTARRGRGATAPTDTGNGDTATGASIGSDDTVTGSGG